jgi:hypothetical protein
MATAWAGDVTPASIHEAATKAVAALQNSQKIWYTKETCASCHQQVFPAMAFRAAREHGIPVDEQAALADAQAAFGFYSDLDRAVEYSYVIDRALGDGYSAWTGCRGSAAERADGGVRTFACRKTGGRWALGDL